MRSIIECCLLLRRLCKALFWCKKHLQMKLNGGWGNFWFSFFKKVPFLANIKHCSRLGPDYEDFNSIKKIFLERYLTLSWRRPLSYRNQSIDLLWFLYDNVMKELMTWLNLCFHYQKRPSKGKFHCMKIFH